MFRIDKSLMRAGFCKTKKDDEHAELTFRRDNMAPPSSSVSTVARASSQRETFIQVNQCSPHTRKNASLNGSQSVFSLARRSYGCVLRTRCIRVQLYTALGES